jgi:hypothetical protein
MEEADFEQQVDDLHAIMAQPPSPVAAANPAFRGQLDTRLSAATLGLQDVRDIQSSADASGVARDKLVVEPSMSPSLGLPEIYQVGELEYGRTVQEPGGKVGEGAVAEEQKDQVRQPSEGIRSAAVHTLARIFGRDGASAAGGGRGAEEEHHAELLQGSPLATAGGATPQGFFSPVRRYIEFR